MTTQTVIITGGATGLGFALLPILISAGFFGAAPREGTKPTRFIVLIIVGAIVLAASLLVLGLGLLFQ